MFTEDDKDTVAPQTKWAKEIAHWVKGGKVESRTELEPTWSINIRPWFWHKGFEFRIHQPNPHKKIKALYEQLIKDGFNVEIYSRVSNGDNFKLDESGFNNHSARYRLVIY